MSQPYVFVQMPDPDIDEIQHYSEEDEPNGHEHWHLAARIILTFLFRRWMLFWDGHAL